MANNRMYLRCKACGETFFLGKRFGDGYYINQYEQDKGVPLMERLNKFYDDHEWCGGAGLDCFELIYEDPPEAVTNADKIRAMTDEELAEFFQNTTFCVSCFIYKNECGKKDYPCSQRFLEWLKIPAEEDET